MTLPFFFSTVPIHITCRASHCRAINPQHHSQTRTDDSVLSGALMYNQAELEPQRKPCWLCHPKAGSGETILAIYFTDEQLLILQISMRLLLCNSYIKSCMAAAPSLSCSVCSTSSFCAPCLESWAQPSWEIWKSFSDSCAPWICYFFSLYFKLKFRRKCLLLLCALWCHLQTICNWACGKGSTSLPDTKLFLTQFLFAFIDDLLCCKMSSFAPWNTLLPSHKKRNLQEQFLKFISGGKP